MKRVVGVIAGVTVLVTGLVGPVGPTGPVWALDAAGGGTGAYGTAPGARAVPDAAHPAPWQRRPGRQEISWEPCKRPGSSAGLGAVLPRLAASGRTRAPGEECASIRVPLDYAEPYGQQITIALNRIRGTVSRDADHLGSLLVNPGGPGGSGLGLARFVAAQLPRDVAARFDVIGFDPRGVGDSRPAISCVDPERYFAPPRPDNVPRGKAEEDVLVARARQYAEACGNRWSWFLPYLTTENTARDMDMIRAALGEEEISYLGYSYGTYLGAVYATLFPTRVRRLVLDSVVDPGGDWYDVNLAQDLSFQRRQRDFLAWIAEHDDAYRLGRTEKAVTFAWSSMRSRLRERPAGGIIGPSELDDIYTSGGYSNLLWPALAEAFSAYVHRGETTGLVKLFRSQAEVDAEEENSYAVYLGIECRDSAWPRDWSRWHADTVKMHAKAPFMAWQNAVYNAPCAFWPVRGGKPVKIGSDRLPPVLLIQAERDAATPYVGALRMRDRFPTARLLTEVRGGNHGVSLAGNACVDQRLAAYLRDATRLPRRGAARGPDATCAAQPGPRPAVRKPAARASAPGAERGHRDRTRTPGR
ncbi:alpha/beta hydrolase [Sphaerimonospora mesophila]|uniref:alpha/beta hydrolase n=1 Tax=Sphaerimonospora mesophila TaxID=37483 RepID=UPI0007C847AA